MALLAIVLHFPFMHGTIFSNFTSFLQIMMFPIMLLFIMFLCIMFWNVGCFKMLRLIKGQFTEGSSFGLTCDDLRYQIISSEEFSEDKGAEYFEGRMYVLRYEVVLVDL